ncbi:CAMK2D protein-like protein, partial [Dinothrombium tinctorium]
MASIRLREINTLSEEYEFMEDLTKGLFFVVKRCSNKKTTKEFAAKIIHLTKLSAREFNRLQREVKICLKLNHPNIVRLHHTSNENGLCFLFFELVPGGDVFKVLVANDYYTEPEACFAIKQVLEAVQYFHNLNIIHRDLKPENLLTLTKSPDSIIKVSDFSLAVETDGNVFGNFGLVGTLAYMAPEIVKKEKYGKPVDIWCCGVILYLLLVGYPPFWEENKEQLINKIKIADFEFQLPEWNFISDAAKELIRMMLTIDPHKRVTSSAALNHKWIVNNANIV